jgi:hypothetical protein
MMLITDASRYEKGVKELLTIWDEIMTYLMDRFPPQQEPTLTVHNDSLVWNHGHPRLKPKILFFGISKTDLVGDQDIIAEIQTCLITHLRQKLTPFIPIPIPHTIRHHSVYPFSCGTYDGITPLLDQWQTLLSHPFPPDDTSSHDHDIKEHTITHHIHTSRLHRPSLTIRCASWDEITHLRQRGYSFPEGKTVWHCADDDLARLVAMTMRDREQGVQWFWTIAEKEGRLTACDRAGIQIGDIIVVHGPYTNPINVIVYTKGGEMDMMR